MAETEHTPTPWKAVTSLRFWNGSGMEYTSVQPVQIDPESMGALKMASGQFHVCRMTHTDNEARSAVHKANAAYIVKAVNSHAAMVEALHALGMVALQTDEYRRNAELREAVDNALALTLSQGEQP